MDADSFHRLAKVLADSGEAATVDEAQRLIAGYGVRIIILPSAVRDPGAQIIALTAINTATRSFLGNVEVVAPRDTVLTAPGHEGVTLGSFLDWLGVSEKFDRATQSWPVIEVDLTPDDGASSAIRPWADGWRFGIGRAEPSGLLFVPACVAAGALAVSEAFSLLRGDNPYAGRRNVALSLWCPSTGAQGPSDMGSIPSSWLIGLGHLGQAYAWTLGFMKPPSSVILYLQDVDLVTRSTLSTSVLSCATDLRARKTRVVARWLEDRGYETAIVERRFDQAQRVGASEPRMALFGVDNAAARRVMEGAGFRRIVDAGLGAGFRDFRAMRVRTFPGPASAATIWAEDAATTESSAPAYRALLANGADPCGVTMLASRAVGAPFVGCVAAAFVVAEVLREQTGGGKYDYIDLNLRNPEGIDAG